MEAPSVSGFTKARAVICPMMINLCIGSYYAYSNVNPYIATHMQTQSDNTIVVMQIWLLFQSLFSIVGVKLSEVIGYWAVNFIAFTGFAVINFIASYITSWEVFIAFYGIGSGIFIGLGYLPALYTAWTYFPEKKSAVTGVILFCAGMSASILSPISTMIVNPDNKSATDPACGANVPKLFKFFSIYFGIIALVACTLQPAPLNTSVYQETKEKKKILEDANADEKDKQEAKEALRRLSNVQLADGEDYLDDEDINMVYREELKENVGEIGGEAHALLGANMNTDRIADLVVRQMKFAKIIEDDRFNEKASIADKSNFQSGPQDLHKYSKMLEKNAETLYKKSKQLQEENCPSIKYAFKSGSFIALCLMAICCSLYPYFLNSNWKSYYLTKLEGISDSKMSFILTFGAVANSGIRIVIGFVLLKVDVKMIYYFIITLAIFGAFTIVELLESYEIGVTYVMLAYCGLGTQVTLFPTICTKVFGSTIGPKVYPYIYLCFSVSNFTQYFLYKYYGKLSDDHISTMFFIFGGMAILGAVIAVLFDPKPSWTNAIYRFNLEKQIKDEEEKLIQEKKKVRPAAK